MFVDALDSKIEERKARVSRLETTERDIEESISIKKKYVKGLLKKIGKMEHFIDLQEDLGDAKEAMEDLEAQLQVGILADRIGSHTGFDPSDWWPSRANLHLADQIRYS